MDFMVLGIESIVRVGLTCILSTENYYNSDNKANLKTTVSVNITHCFSKNTNAFNCFLR